MYYFDSRVRYSEVDCEQNLTCTALLNYFQDCCTFQSEDLGIGLDFLEKKHEAWVLISWQVVFLHKPRLGEHIRVNTWPYDFGGFYGYRNFTMKDEQGKVVAYANSVWAYIDTISGKPVKLAQELLEAYHKEPAYDMEYADRKIRMPKETESADTFEIHTSQLDTNYHVNNEKYIEMAQEYLPKDFEIGQIRVEYKKSAVLGDVVHPYIYRNETESLIMVALSDDKAKPFAIVEFSKK